MERGGDGSLFAQAVVRLHGFLGRQGNEFDVGGLERLPGFRRHSHSAKSALPHDEQFWRGLEYRPKVAGV